MCPWTPHLEGFLYRHGRDWRGGGAVAAAMEPKGGTPESPLHKKLPQENYRTKNSIIEFNGEY